MMKDKSKRNYIQQKEKREEGELRQQRKSFNEFIKEAIEQWVLKVERGMKK
jgi:hypothetical protein